MSTSTLPPCWLMKSEPAECSIHDVAAHPERTVAWVGVRNYQARNFMRQQMQVGDWALFYHSSCAEPGIAGWVEIASSAYPDPTQFDPNSAYFDPKSKPEQPRWWLVEVRLLGISRFMSLAEMRQHPALANMQVLARGNRLSITPVRPDEAAFLLQQCPWAPR